METMIGSTMAEEWGANGGAHGVGLTGTPSASPEELAVLSVLDLARSSRSPLGRGELHLRVGRWSRGRRTLGGPER